VHQGEDVRLNQDLRVVLIDTQGRPVRAPVRPSDPEVIARRRLLLLGRDALAGLVLAAAGRAGADDVTEALAELGRRTREYEDTLATLLGLEERAVASAAAAAERYRSLHARGLVARNEVESAELALAQARERLEGTRRELEDSRRVVVEAAALGRLAALPPPPAGGERSTPGVLEYRGVTAWTLAQVESLERFFNARFGRPLPVSALGQTPLHDRLGFDHRNALDVAVHPDTPEGRALLDHLRAHGVPFLAFRGPVAGASTGAHVHVGAASPRAS
jgi:hypothetical protein